MERKIDIGGLDNVGMRAYKGRRKATDHIHMEVTPMVRLVLSCKTLDFGALKRALQLDDDSTLEEISGVFPIGTITTEAEPCPEPTRES